MSNAFSISQVAEIFRAREVKPDETFTAAAGREYGYVDAWDLSGWNGYLIEYGDNGRTDYAISSNGDDLSDWLTYRPELDALDKILLTANILGHEMLLGASSISSGPFCIVRTKLFYGPKESSAFVSPDGWCGGIRKFETYAEAQEWVESEEGASYVSASDEIGRPVYTIVRG